MGWMDYLTTSEVAAYLRVKERTVYDLVARKAIPCSRVTGKLIFPRRLVDRWLDSHVHLAEGAALLRSDMSFEAFVQTLGSDFVYLNIHTDAYQDGEISGRLRPQG